MTASVTPAIAGPRSKDGTGRRVPEMLDHDPEPAVSKQNESSDSRPAGFADLREQGDQCLW